MNALFDTRECLNKHMNRILKPHEWRLRRRLDNLGKSGETQEEVFAWWDEIVHKAHIRAEQLMLEEMLEAL